MLTRAELDSIGTSDRTRSQQQLRKPSLIASRVRRKIRQFFANFPLVLFTALCIGLLVGRIMYSIPLSSHSKMTLVSTEMPTTLSGDMHDTNYQDHGEQIIDEPHVLDDGDGMDLDKHKDQFSDDDDNDDSSGGVGGGFDGDVSTAQDSSSFDASKIKHHFLSLMRKYDHQRSENYEKVEILMNPSSSLFFKNIVVKNRPAVIQDVLHKWNAIKWNDVNLKKLVGSNYVEALSLLDPTTKKNMTMNEFLDSYSSSGSAKDKNYILSDYSIPSKFPQLLNDFPEIPSFLPPIFKSEGKKIWIGGGNEILPLHADQHETLLCQIQGTRKIYLFDPLQADLLYLKPGTRLSQVDPSNADQSQFPLFKYAKPIVVELKRGDILYLPEMWFHHVISGPGEENIALNLNYAPTSSILQLFYNTLPTPFSNLDELSNMGDMGDFQDPMEQENSITNEMDKIQATNSLDEDEFNEEPIPNSRKKTKKSKKASKTSNRSPKSQKKQAIHP